MVGVVVAAVVVAPPRLSNRLSNRHSRPQAPVVPVILYESTWAGLDMGMPAAVGFKEAEEEGLALVLLLADASPVVTSTIPVEVANPVLSFHVRTAAPVPVVPAEVADLVECYHLDDVVYVSWEYPSH